MNGDELRLNFDVQDSSMRGMFLFKSLVTNLGQFLQYWSLVSTQASKSELTVFLA